MMTDFFFLANHLCRDVVCRYVVDFFGLFTVAPNNGNDLWICGYMQNHIGIKNNKNKRREFSSIATLEVMLFYFINPIINRSNF